MIDLSLDLRGVEELTKGNERFLRQVSKALKNSLTRTLRRTATGVRRDLASVGIARAIWGGRLSGLAKQKLVTVIEPKGRGDAIVTGLRFKGIPRLIEEGGRLKPHPIKASGRGFLVFEGRVGLVRTRLIKRHPGATVARKGFGALALRRDEGAISEDVNRSIQNTVNWAYGEGSSGFEVNF